MDPVEAVAPLTRLRSIKSLETDLPVDESQREEQDVFPPTSRRLTFPYLKRTSHLRQNAG